MNYNRIYNSLVERARHRPVNGYVERHHIIPRCMGGDDSPLNIVPLTAEEHFVAHQLLVKIYPENLGLIYSLARLSAGKSVVRNNKLYGWIKRLLAEERSKAMVGHTIWIGRKHSEKTKRKISESLLGKNRINSKEKSDKGISNPLKSHPHSDESKSKISKTKSGIPKEKYKCWQCGKLAAAHLINRYHNNSCKKTNS